MQVNVSNILPGNGLRNYLQVALESCRQTEFLSITTQNILPYINTYLKKLR